MRRLTFDHEFVEFIPSELNEGILYISVQYATAAHKCACGCGNKVVTPISPVGWQLLFDGKSVSLTPSVGNWQFPCRSHYWIKLNKVRWAEAWTTEQIAAGRQHEEHEYEQYFAAKEAASNATEQTDAGVPTERRPRQGLLARVLRWFGY